MIIVISSKSLEDLRSYANGFKELGYDQEGLYLFQNSGWNDYSHRSHFMGYYYSSNNDADPISIGIVKLCPNPEKMSDLYKYISDDSNSNGYIKLKEDVVLGNNNSLCSCPIVLDYYYDLYHELNMDLERLYYVLKVMGDVACLPDSILNEYEKLPIYKESILRNDRLFKPNVISFIKVLKNTCAHNSDEMNTLDLIVNPYNELSKCSKGEIRTFCSDLNDSGLEYAFLTPFIQCIFNSIEEKGSITEKDLRFYALKYTISDDDNTELEGNLFTVLKNIVAIRKILFFKWDSSQYPRLGHYTRISNVPKLIGFGIDSYYRFTCSAQLNDPLEGKTLFDYLNKAIIRHDDEKDEVVNNISSLSQYYFIASATAEGDSLPMWKQYTDDADGVYMIFSDDYLTKISSVRGMIFGKICYLDYSDTNKIKCIVDNTESPQLEKHLKAIYDTIQRDPDLFNVDNGLINYLTEISFLFKCCEYSYENEYRIFIESSVDNIDEFDAGKNYSNEQTSIAVITESDGNPIPRLRIAVTACPVVYESIRIGPKGVSKDYVEPYVVACYQKNQTAFNSVEGHINYPPISIEESKIHYR